MDPAVIRDNTVYHGKVYTRFGPQKRGICTSPYQLLSARSGRLRGCRGQEQEARDFPCIYEVSRLSCLKVGSTMNWWQVLGTAEHAPLDHCVRHPLPALGPLLEAFSAQQTRLFGLGFDNYLCLAAS
jgi:hypothetical protein